MFTVTRRGGLIYTITRRGGLFLKGLILREIPEDFGAMLLFTFPARQSIVERQVHQLQECLGVTRTRILTAQPA